MYGLTSVTGPLVGKHALKLSNTILLTLLQTGGALTGDQVFLFMLEELHLKPLFQNDYLGVGAFISISRFVVSLLNV